MKTAEMTIAEVTIAEVTTQQMRQGQQGVRHAAASATIQALI
jgi:hypothetical protein